MKKKQLSKLALIGLATGVAMTAAVDASTMTEKNGTYLAGGCGGSGCGGKNRSNPSNYTADTYTIPSNAPVNPNTAPKPEAIQNNPNTANGQNCSANRPANGQYQQQNQVRQGSCAGAKPVPYPNQTQGQPQARNSCAGARPAQGQPASHGCSSQTAGCGAKTNNGYRR
ncbi:MAG TPA: hypothetical protein PLC42_05270 [Parachlamydiaceae bacterium]|nr:hypothetical protein [Parachlamydiaceae bacterium]